MYARVDEAAAAVRSRCGALPETAIVLGSGLGDFADGLLNAIATFALCGFANFSSIGIQIGGIGALAPERRHDLARLGLRAMLAGTFANFLTATIAGMLL